jgi:hypothetical protein
MGKHAGHRQSSRRHSLRVMGDIGLEHEARYSPARIILAQRDVAIESGLKRQTTRRVDHGSSNGEMSKLSVMMRSWRESGGVLFNTTRSRFSSGF